MDNRKRLGSFLTTKRKALNIEDFNIQDLGNRKVSGLRREEVALFSGISLTLYTWLEQGRSINVSADVIDQISSTLKLSDKERAQFYVLSKGVIPALERKKAFDLSVLEPYQSIIDDFNHFPVVIIDRYWHIALQNESANYLLGEFSKENNHFIWKLMNGKISKQLKDYDNTIKQVIQSFRYTMAYNIDSIEKEEVIKMLSDSNPVFQSYWEDNSSVTPEDDMELVLKSPNLNYHIKVLELTEKEHFMMLIMIPKKQSQ